MRYRRGMFFIALVAFCSYLMFPAFPSEASSGTSATKALAGLKSAGRHTGAQVSRLGTVSFPVSCSPQVQADFNTAVALLDSFQYDLAQKAFAAIAQSDSQCAMAYWGEAMTLYRELWMWPEHLQQGRQYIEQAQKAGAKSERERLYIKAMDLYYQNNADMNSAARAVAYSNAMAKLHQSYPNDENATAFYALSLIAVRSPNKSENMTRRMQAIGILQKLFQKEPNDPGVAHYLIHATDTPELAHLGLDAARRYSKIAPDAPHALHMPSHIFTELGMWQDSIDSNLASAAAAEKITHSSADDDSGDQLHALSFLEYAYLQTGHDADVQRVIGEIQRVPGATPEQITTYQTMFQVMYFEETFQWKRAVTLVPPSNGSPMIKSSAYGIRALAEAHLGESSAAQTDIENYLKASQEAEAAMKGMGMMMDDSPHSGEPLKQLEVEAWVAVASGKSDEAIAKMKAAVDLTKTPMMMGGVPGVPTEEMMGDLLMQLHRPAEALAAYRDALKIAPNRFDSLYGAAQAARLAGNAEAAKQYFAELIKICGPKADRAELQEVRGSLASN